MRTIVETLQPGIPYHVRQWLAPRITRVARTLGQPDYRLRDTEYVGTVQQSLGEFTETLQENGFEWDPLAWYHQPPVGAEPDGSWTYRRTLLAERQLHVILVAQPADYIDVFAHDEYNWLRHPIKHFLQVDIAREVGKREMQHWIESHGMEVDTKSRRRRRFANAINDLRQFLRTIIQ